MPNGWEIRNGYTVDGFRAKLPKVEKYGPYSILGLRMKVTESLSSAGADQVNIIATRKLPIWNGTAWSAPTATRSIAWALADMYMSTYGSSRPASSLDLAQLLALDTIWSSRGDTFDGIFDSTVTIWEALGKVSRAGRARPVFDGSILTFVRDTAQSTYSAVYTYDNIIENSFSMNYSFPDNQDPDGYIVKYQDEDANYTPAKVQSSENLSKAIEIDFFGCVNYEQAWRESQYLESVLLNKKVQISFSTDIAGFIPFYGDLISLQNGFQGICGQVVAKDGTTITTSQPLDWTGVAPFYMAFMKPNGALSGPHTVTQGSGDYEAVLSVDVTDFTFKLRAGSSQNPTIYQFGESTEWNKPAIVTKVTPNSKNEQVKIECVPYIAGVHTADEGAVPTKESTTPTGLAKPPRIGGLVLTNAPQSGEVMAIWNPLHDIDNYKVQKSTDNSSWTDVSTPSVTTATISATGILYVRVASAIGAIVGEYTKQVIIAT